MLSRGAAPMPSELAAARPVLSRRQFPENRNHVVHLTFREAAGMTTLSASQIFTPAALAEVVADAASHKPQMHFSARFFGPPMAGRIHGSAAGGGSVPPTLMSIQPVPAHRRAKRAAPEGTNVGTATLTMANLAGSAAAVAPGVSPYPASHDDAAGVSTTPPHSGRRQVHASASGVGTPHPRPPPFWTASADAPPPSSTAQRPASSLGRRSSSAPSRVPAADFWVSDAHAHCRPTGIRTQQPRSASPAVATTAPPPFTSRVIDPNGVSATAADERASVRHSRPATTGVTHSTMTASLPTSARRHGGILTVIPRFEHPIRLPRSVAPTQRHPVSTPAVSYVFGSVPLGKCRDDFLFSSSHTQAGPSVQGFSSSQRSRSAQPARGCLPGMSESDAPRFATIPSNVPLRGESTERFTGKRVIPAPCHADLAHGKRTSCSPARHSVSENIITHVPLTQYHRSVSAAGGAAVELSAPAAKFQTGKRFSIVRA